MPIDSRIPLQTTTIDPSQGLNALAGAFKYREQQKERDEDRAMKREEFDLRKGEIEANKELRGLQVAAAKFQQLDAREQRRLKSTILGAAQLNTYLDAGDTEGAASFLQTRRGQIEQAKAIDPSFDTNETDQAIGMLQSGDVAGLKAITTNSIKLGQALKILDKPEKVTTFAPVYDSQGKIVAQRDEKTGEVKTDPRAAEKSKPSSLSQLLSERDALPAGSPHRATYDEAIKKAASHQPGTSVTVTPNGPLLPAKTTQGKIDESLMESGGRLMRLDNIAASFKPEYQTFGTQMGTRWAALKEKGGVGLSGADTKKLTEFSKFKSGALANLNLYIKEITGAAMSEVEANRIRQAMPDPGSGLFDGDSPTQFKAKLDDSIRLVKMAEARNVYLKRNGMSLANEKGEPIVPLEKMPSLINQRGTEIEAQLKKAQPGVDAKALKRAVVRQLGQEFGLASD